MCTRLQEVAMSLSVSVKMLQEGTNMSLGEAVSAVLGIYDDVHLAQGCVLLYKAFEPEAEALAEELKVRQDIWINIENIFLGFVKLS
jgi:hypothetical protein